MEFVWILVFEIWSLSAPAPSLLSASPFNGAYKFMLKAGIVGLPNVGKSTLFNAVTRTRKAEAANYPFCTIDPNVGIVTVPDARLAVLKDIAKTTVVIPAAVEFVDIGQSISNWNVADEDQQNIQLPIQNLSAGTYIVKVITDKGESSKKIILN